MPPSGRIAALRVAGVVAASDEGTIGVDGTIEWRDEAGELHRDDGPAAAYPDGRRVWFVEGVKVREERRS